MHHDHVVVLTCHYVVLANYFRRCVTRNDSTIKTNPTRTILSVRIVLIQISSGTEGGWREPDSRVRALGGGGGGGGGGIGYRGCGVRAKCVEDLREVCGGA